MCNEGDVFDVKKEYDNGVNLYEYVNSVPTNRVDPNGLLIELPPIIWAVNLKCCTCLAYAETGKRGENCLTAIAHVMKNRQKSDWPDFGGEDSFCHQAKMSGRWNAGFGNERFDKCWEDCETNPWELEEIGNAAKACFGAMTGGADPTGGAQYAFARGQAPNWIYKPPGNCRKVDVPNCTITEFWKCKNRPPPL